MKPVKWHSKYYTSSENLREFLDEINGDPRFGPEIIEALENNNADIRRDAINSICRELKFMTRGSKEQLAGQNRHQRAINKSKNPFTIRKRWASSYEEAHKHNSSVQYYDKVFELLIKALNDEGTFVRIAAAGQLGNIGYKRAVKPLIKALKDKAPYVRGTAAGALGYIGDKQAVEPLIRTLKVKSNEVYVRVNAAEALGYFGKRAVEGLIEGLDLVKAVGLRAPQTGTIYSPYTLYKPIYKSLINIAKKNIKGKEKDNVMKFLKSKDPAMVRMGAAMLKGILEE